LCSGKDIANNLFQVLLFINDDSDATEEVLAIKVGIV
jgi:hypothetical protein